MAKINTSTIEGYDSMSAEEKVKALEALEYEDYSSENEKLKRLNEKANTEAAEWKRKHNALLTEDEKKKQEDADRVSAMEKELEELRRDKLVSGYAQKYMAQGFTEELAMSTAKALESGDMNTVFANQQKFLEDYAKTVRSEQMKGVPRPQGGVGTGEVDYSKKIEEARSAGDNLAVAYYTRLQAEAEASTK